MNNTNGAFVLLPFSSLWLFCCCSDKDFVVLARHHSLTFMKNISSCFLLMYIGMFSASWQGKLSIHKSQWLCISKTLSVEKNWLLKLGYHLFRSSLSYVVSKFSKLVDNLIFSHLLFANCAAWFQLLPIPTLLQRFYLP